MCSPQVQEKEGGLALQTEERVEPTFQVHRTKLILICLVFVFRGKEQFNILRGKNSIFIPYEGGIWKMIYY